MNRLLTLTFLMTASLGMKGQSVTDFEKKWNIDGYIYLGMTFSPEESEKDDYLHFLKDGTFKSMEEGDLEEGTWEWKASEKSIYVRQEEEFLAMEVVKIKEDQLILLIEEDGESIEIKYKTDVKKN